MGTTKQLSWANIEAEAARLAERQSLNSAITHVYGIPQGGAPVAIMVARHLGLALAEEPLPGRTLIVDDLVDTGTTLQRYRSKGYMVDALYRKPWSPDTLAPGATLVEEWLAFPWERDEGTPTDAVIRLLQHIGEDPTRDGLLDTPARVCKALREMTVGYSMNAADILAKTFDVEHDDLVIVSGIDYWSLCEHHLLPFYGQATVGYIPRPGSRVVGLSKLARLVECFSKRLQVQERMTNDIANALQDALEPLGVGVVITGNHSCMRARGIQADGVMTTSAMLGVMRDKPEARAEFLALSHAPRA